ncbi:transporter substrate-binding domain-containing protein [Rhodoplanes sp. SY1]|uniref:transporter substrate-binding domain-containing protein n=1 Tax=Rhodoplanes sp. SY1 TaxID=3166646 RepID=UPI0038B657F1
MSCSPAATSGSGRSSSASPAFAGGDPRSSRPVTTARSLIQSEGLGRSMDQFESKDRLIAGVSFDIPGMGYKDPRTGAIEGFEPDLARAIAQDIFGAPDRVDFHQVHDAGRIQALQDHAVDMVISQLTITPDRAEQVLFSTPYCVTGEAILVPTDSTIERFEDLAGKRIAVTAGSVSIRRMQAALPSLPGATLVVTPLSAGNLEAVAKGEADAASNDLINLTLMQRRADHPERYRIIDIGKRFDPKPFGAAVEKSRHALVARLNQAIERLKANGEIDRLLDAALAGAGSRAAPPD